MPQFQRAEPRPSGPADHQTAFALSSILRYLDNCRSTWAIVLFLLPLFLLLLMPVGFSANEYNYFMLAFRRVSPASFSEFSAVFDASNGRIVWELILGTLINWLGYDLAHMLLRLGMAGTYAVSVGYLLSTLRLSAFDGILVLGIFLVVGQDILGKEWLFQGVESKTFAYALVMVGLALVIKRRWTLAVLAAALATYFHFLVGGFWLVALLAYDAIHDFSLKRQARIFAIYMLLVGPLAVVLVYEQLGPSGAAPSVPTASFIYSIFRAPHHAAPFSSKEQLRSWAPDIVLLVALSLSFLLLARSNLAKTRPLVCWVSGLLCYLIAALALSALDGQTGYWGKFYLFRPSSLTLFCAIAALLSVLNDLDVRSSIKPTLRFAAFLIVIPIAIFWVVTTKAGEFSNERRAISEDIARLNAFILETSKPDEIILVQPGGEYIFPKVALPMLLDRPTLVSFKFIPTNAHDIYRWYELIQYRDGVFGEQCKEIGRFPVRYLLMTQARDMNVPCGRVVWRSKYFALVEP